MTSKRRVVFIDRDFQTKFIVKFSFIVLVSSFVIGALVFLFTTNNTTVAFEDTHLTIKRTADFILPLLVETVVIVTISSVAAVICLALYTSHKIAGPLYRIKKEIDRLGAGDLSVNFRTRKNDQVKELSQALFEMKSALEKNHKDLKAGMERLKKDIKDGDKDKVAEAVHGLNEAVSYFGR